MLIQWTFVVSDVQVMDALLHFKKEICWLIWWYFRTLPAGPQRRGNVTNRCSGSGNAVSSERLEVVTPYTRYVLSLLMQFNETWRKRPVRLVPLFHWTSVCSVFVKFRVRCASGSTTYSVILERGLPTVWKQRTATNYFCQRCRIQQTLSKNFAATEVCGALPQNNAKQTIHS
jgi:hypothetical protein